MKRVVAYCRSASEPQGGPSAVQKQAQAILSDVQRGVSLVYVDAGVSGIAPERPALQQLIADCLAGKIATIVTQDPERLSRDSTKLLVLLDIFREADVRVEFITGGERIPFLLTVLSAVSELEKRRKAK
jgi:DNA invertase Pin-like site-specific DNA recombinase